MDSIQDLTVYCGNTDDSFEKLKSLCDNEAKKLCSMISIAPDSTVEVTFLTEDFPEFICVGRFLKDGEVVKYELDFSESTL